MSHQTLSPGTAAHAAAQAAHTLREVAGATAHRLGDLGSELSTDLVGAAHDRLEQLHLPASIAPMVTRRRSARTGLMRPKVLVPIVVVVVLAALASMIAKRRAASPAMRSAGGATERPVERPVDTAPAA